MVAAIETIESGETYVSDTRTTLDIINQLTKDVRNAAATLRPGEVRYLVDLYYSMQEQRIRAAAQVRAAGDAHEPNALVTWMAGNYAVLENDVRRAMHAYAKSRIEGQWLLSLIGIGPVIAAGLLAHIDITRAPSPSHIWSFAGLNPNAKWGKGEKRPWNANLKRLCWLIGQSFVKTSNNPKSVYGPIYKARKAFEMENNAQGRYAEQAAAILAEKRIGKETVAYGEYSQGRLPAAQIQQRAERYTVKVFLAHLHQVMYETHNGHPAPDVWAIAHGGHVDRIGCPNWPLAA